MKKVILVFGSILIGMTAFGQTEMKTATSQKTTTSEYSVARQIEDLEDMIKRFGATHEESIKAKAMIERLRKDESEAALQQRMQKTLSPAEYDAWKAKQVVALKKTKSLNNSEEKK